MSLRPTELGTLRFKVQILESHDLRIAGFHLDAELLGKPHGGLDVRVFRR